VRQLEVAAAGAAEVDELEEVDELDELDESLELDDFSELDGADDSDLLLLPDSRESVR
jgi:hypothetical protein